MSKKLWFSLSRDTFSLVLWRQLSLLNNNESFWTLITQMALYLLRLTCVLCGRTCRVAPSSTKDYFYTVVGSTRWQARTTWYFHSKWNVLKLCMLYMGNRLLLAEIGYLYLGGPWTSWSFPLPGREYSLESSQVPSVSSSSSLLELYDSRHSILYFQTQFLIFRLSGT